MNEGRHAKRPRDAVWPLLRQGAVVPNKKTEAAVLVAGFALIACLIGPHHPRSRRLRTCRAETGVGRRDRPTSVNRREVSAYVRRVRRASQSSPATCHTNSTSPALAPSGT